MVDSLGGSAGAQAAASAQQMRQEVGVKVQKEAMDTQQQAMTPLIQSIGDSSPSSQGNQLASSGSVGTMLNTSA